MSYDSGAYRSGTQAGHRWLSQSNYEIYCTKRQTKYDHPRQRNKRCWSRKRDRRVPCILKQRKDRKTSNSTRNQMEIQPSRSTSLWRIMGTVDEKLQESNVCSVGEQISHRVRSFNYDMYYRADIVFKTAVSSHVNDLEALTPNHFLLGNKKVCLPYLTYTEKIVDYRKLFRQTQAYANLIWDRFCKEYRPMLNNR